jgi:hypothetical protein
MSAATAEQWISQGNDNRIFDQIVANDPTEDDIIFAIIDRCGGLLTPRSRRGAPGFLNLWQGSIMGKSGVYDDICVAQSETEEKDLSNINLMPGRGISTFPPFFLVLFSTPTLPPLSHCRRKRRAFLQNSTAQIF